MESLGIERWVFQFDNDSNHKSTKEKDYLKRKIKTNDLPFYSSDLSPN